MSRSQLLSLPLENMNKSISNNLPLLLRILHTSQLFQKLVAGIDNSQIDAKVLIQSFQDLLALMTPLSTRIAWNRFPIASCISFAATVESTPPETAPMT